MTLFEQISLHATLDMIDIRGSDLDTLVLSQGAPLGINWNDCNGSVAQFLVRANAPNYDEELAELRQILDGKVDDERSIAEQFGLFLQLLTPATYALSIERHSVSGMIEPRVPWNPVTDYDNFYPADQVLVLMQPRSSLNKKTVDRYVQLIKSGQSPVAISVTAEDSWCSYVVDGHHKLAAYRKLNTRPTVFTACRMSPPPLPANVFTDWFSPKHPLASHYAKVKTEYDV